MIRTNRPESVTARPHAPPVLMITAAQAEAAVLILRERAGRPAAEQFAALVRVLGLTVVTDPTVPAQRG